MHVNPIIINAYKFLSLFPTSFQENLSLISLLIIFFTLRARKCPLYARSNKKACAKSSFVHVV